jgi:L-lactate dehydrogenase complex protein LldE
MLPRAGVMRVALFVPCYVDQLYPDVGFASLELLEAHGVRAEVPVQQTCCGQVLTNRGALAAAQPLAHGFEAVFGSYDHVVCPSGSCAAALRRHPQALGSAPGGAASRVFELCQFLVQVLGVEHARVDFPHRVLLHESCHSLRELGLGQPSELGAVAAPIESPARRLLRQVPQLELLEPTRRDECCGFGGSFSLAEPDVSARMGSDRLDDFEQAGAAVVTSADMSCLMHLSGLMLRQGRPLSVLHIAQVLVGRTPSAPGLPSGNRSA